MHYKTVLSGDLVIKSGEIRDQISVKFHDVLCFEMEAARLTDTFPCLVIRGFVITPTFIRIKTDRNIRQQQPRRMLKRFFSVWLKVIVENLKNSVPSIMESASGNTESAAPKAIEEQKGHSFSVPSQGTTTLVSNWGKIREQSAALLLEKEVNKRGALSLGLRTNQENANMALDRFAW